MDAVVINLRNPPHNEDTAAPTLSKALLPIEENRFLEASIMGAATIRDPIASCQALALVTLLETFRPRMALKPYLVQLKTVVADLEAEDQQLQLQQLKDIHRVFVASQASLEETPCEGCAEESVPGPVGKPSFGSNTSGAPRAHTSIKSPLSMNSPISVSTKTELRRNHGLPEDRDASGGENATVAAAAAAPAASPKSLPPLYSPARHPRNEVASPIKPCATSREMVRSPFRSSSSFPSPQQPSDPYQPQEQRQQPSPLASPKLQLSSSFGDRYHDKNRFLDDATIVFPLQNSIKKFDAGFEPATDPAKEAFDTPEIVSRILEFDGSLAAFYKNYDLLEGYKSPMPRRRSQSRFQRRTTGNRQLAFVNKHFASLVIGAEGLEAWKREARCEIEDRKRISRQIVSGANPSPLAKVFAIVIRNDAIEFEYLLRKHVVAIEQGNSLHGDHSNDIFGMALTEYVNGGGDPFGDSDSKRAFGAQSNESRRSMGLPRGHAFLRFCSCWEAKECDYTTLLAELAYNAVVCGALDVLGVISKRHNTLYSTAFGPSGSQSLLGLLVAQTCAQPCCLVEVAQGIRTLMSHQRLHREDLNACQLGSHGTSLHVAAAKGDRELVEALLDVGYHPGVRCDQWDSVGRGTNGNSNVSGSHQAKDGSTDRLWYPEDWARVRGHTDVARLLERRRRQLEPRQDLQSLSELDSVLSETSTRFTVASSYQPYDDSDSSCSSTEYDSDSSDVFDSEIDQDGDYSAYTSESSRFYSPGNYPYTIDDLYRSPRRKLRLIQTTAISR